MSRPPSRAAFTSLYADLAGKASFHLAQLGGSAPPKLLGGQGDRLSFGVACSSLETGAFGRSAGLATRLPIELTKFFLGFCEDFALFAGKLLAGTVDVEVEHRHCGAKRGALASIAVVGGPLE